MIKTVNLRNVEEKYFHFIDKKVRSFDGGGSRITCKYGDLCIKLGGQGSHEIEIFNNLTEEEKSFFNPIIAHGVAPWNMGKWDTPCNYVWVAQPWLPKIIKATKKDMYSRQFAQLAEVITSKGLIDVEYYRHNGTWRLHNWTVIDGKPICYDYGF